MEYKAPEIEILGSLTELTRVELLDGSYETD